MGRVRKVLRGALPISRVGAAMWAWRHRQEIAGWTTWAAQAAPRVAAGDTRDVVTEGRLRARLTGDGRTRGVQSLQVRVSDGVAVLEGQVGSEVHDAAISIAADTGGVQRVRDELREPRSR
ncbi:MAG: BON domain-containing protein [Acidimicrobiales bacterium]